MRELPNGWAETTLGKVTLPFETTDPTRRPDETFQYIDIGSIDNQTQTITQPKSILGRDAPSRARRVVKKDDVLFSTVRTYLKNIAVVPESLDSQLTSTGIAVLRPSEALDGRYLFNWVKSDEFISTMSKAQDGTLYPAVTDKDVSGGRIPLPPLHEQKRIVAKVDGLTARPARARADLDRIPTLIARYKQSLLALAFSGELTAGWRKTKALNDFETVKLHSLCLSVTDGDHQAPPRSDSGIPFITISAMNTGRIDLSKATRAVPRSYFDEIKESRRPAIGDVLFSVTGSIGIPALVETDLPFVFQRHIAIMKPNTERVSGRFLSYLLASPQIREQVDAIATGTAQLTVPLGGLRQFDFPCPTLEEQAEIVRLITSAFNWVDRMAADHAAAADLLPKLDAAILAKAFRGELVPQDPSDEPASALLERVQVERNATSRNPRGRRLAGVSEVIEIQLPPIQIHVSVGPVTIIETRGRQAMTKSRQDDDVMGKPYLASLLKEGHSASAQDLFKAADLPVADFYKQLAWEIANKHIRDDDEKLEAL